MHLIVMNYEECLESIVLMRDILDYEMMSLVIIMRGLLSQERKVLSQERKVLSEGWMKIVKDYVQKVMKNNMVWSGLSLSGVLSGRD